MEKIFSLTRCTEQTRPSLEANVNSAEKLSSAISRGLWKKKKDTGIFFAVTNNHIGVVLVQS